MQRYASSMRRIAPWLPVAMALATLTVGALQAVAQDTTEQAPRWIVFLPHMIILFGPVPYLIPMLLLEWAKSVRRRSAAPPSIVRTAVVLALPALVMAVVWPLGLGIAFLVRATAVARALLVDHRLACIAVWATSVIVTAMWGARAAGRWIWWTRPAAVVRTGPYR